jgi:hypothetical protein
MILINILIKGSLLLVRRLLFCRNPNGRIISSPTGKNYSSFITNNAKAAPMRCIGAAELI